MRTITKLLSALALAVLVSGSAGATSLAILGDTATLPTAGGTVNLTITMTPDAAGVNNYNFDLVSAGAPTRTDTAVANVGFGPAGFVMAPAFGPPILTGLGHVDQISQSSVGASGPNDSATYTIATATFSIGPNLTLLDQIVTFSFSGDFTELFFANNNNEQIFPSLGTFDVTVAAIPEPGTLVLLGFGLSGLVVAGRRRA